MRSGVIKCILFLNLIWVHGNAQDERNYAIQKYKGEYLASEVKSAKEIKWKGSIEKCDEGSISFKIQQKALIRINYFRTLCHLQPIKFNAEHNSTAQKAAFIIYANNQISHDPNKTWRCYSEDTRKSAAHSNLGFNDFIYYPEVAFITAFVDDHGVSNKAVGHRRSILYSRANCIGYGATPKTEAIRNPVRILDKTDSTLFPKYFSYPVGGYNEIDLVFPRWSFSIPDVYKVDFKDAAVELKDETGKAIGVTVLPYEDIYDPTLVWELKDKLKREYFLNHTVIVSVKNVRVNGSLRCYSYEVRFFDYPGE